MASCIFFCGVFHAAECPGRVNNALSRKTACFSAKQASRTCVECVPFTCAVPLDFVFEFVYEELFNCGSSNSCFEEDLKKRENAPSEPLSHKTMSQRVVFVDHSSCLSGMWRYFYFL